MSIDKAKGIICKPMPKSWHDRHTVNKIEDLDKKTFYRDIVADKKPYFMRYIYPALMKQYNTFIKRTNKNALREFQMTVDEMQALPYSELTDRQKEFLRYYGYRMPVGVGDCVMNKICRRFEQEFDGYVKKHTATTDFDYTIMKNEKQYPSSQFYSVKKLYEEYNKRLQGYAIFSSYERVDEYDSLAEYISMNEWFRNECEKICPNHDTLSNILLDICYTRSATKRFAWSVCGYDIIQNLLNNNHGSILFPVLDDSGDIEFCSNRYTIKTKIIEVDE